MKLSEMNKHQKEAFRWISSVMSEYIGGYENTLLDYREEDEEYKEAKELLSKPRAELAEIIYSMVMEESDKGTARHLRFAGTEFIMERINKRLDKWGY